METITIQKNKLPEGWEVKRLGDFIDFVKGKKPNRFTDKNALNVKPYILISSFMNNEHEYYTDDNTCKECSEEDVLIVWDGARAGLSSIGHQGYIGSTITALKQKEKIILPKLLYYFISNHYEIFNKKIQGTGIPHLQKEYVHDLEIPIPQIETQYLIVQKLDAFFESYNKLKQEKQKAKEKYEKILQSAIASLIPQGDKLPEGWEVKKLGELAEIIMGQSPPSKTYNSIKRGLPFFQGKAEFGEFYPIPKKWCSEPKKIAKKNDSLMSIRAPVGPVNLSNSECCIGRGLCAIRAKSKKLDYKYLYNFLKLQGDILAQKGQGSTFAAIGRKEVFEIGIPTPSPNDPKKSLEIQHRIVAKLDAFLKHHNKIKEEQEFVGGQLSQLPKAVLSKAFKGELV